MHLIGISGRAGAGKDEAAKYLAHKYGLYHEAFANVLKTVVAAMAGEPVSYYHEPAMKDSFCAALGMTRRKALQTLGSEAVKPHFGEDFWVRRLLADWDTSGRPPAVISDVRFDVEARGIRQRGGVIIRIERAGQLLGGEAAQHSSEAGVSPHLVDFVIQNNGSLQDLHTALDELMATLTEA